MYIYNTYTVVLARFEHHTAALSFKRVNSKLKFKAVLPARKCIFGKVKVSKSRKQKVLPYSKKPTKIFTFFAQASESG